VTSTAAPPVLKPSRCWRAHLLLAASMSGAMTGSRAAGRLIQLTLGVVIAMIAGVGGSMFI
jgi:hypothetical protein